MMLVWAGEDSFDPIKKMMSCASSFWQLGLGADEGQSGGVGRGWEVMYRRALNSVLSSWDNIDLPQ